MESQVQYSCPGAFFPLARSEDPELALAAYSVAISVTLPLVAPLFGMRQIITALCVDRDMIAKLGRLVWFLGGGATLVVLLLSIPSVYITLTDRILGIPEEISRPGLPVMLLLTSPLLLIGRGYYQGILVHYGTVGGQSAVSPHRRAADVVTVRQRDERGAATRRQLRTTQAFHGVHPLPLPSTGSVDGADSWRRTRRAGRHSPLGAGDGVAGGVCRLCVDRVVGADQPVEHTAGRDRQGQGDRLLSGGATLRHDTRSGDDGIHVGGSDPRRGGGGIW